MITMRLIGQLAEGAGLSEGSLWIFFFEKRSVREEYGLDCCGWWRKEMEEGQLIYHILRGCARRSQGCSKHSSNSNFFPSRDPAAIA
jgi:hypothetical protein